MTRALKRSLLLAFLFTATAVIVALVRVGRAPTTGTREAAITATIDAIEAERGRAAAGDWDGWFRALAPFRDELRPVLEDLQANHQRVDPATGAKVALLSARGTPPLYVEVLSAGHLAAWGTSPPTLDRFLEQTTSLKIIAQTSQWLAHQGIDLIFVPVPKMAQIYPERIVTHVPADRNVAPQARRMLLDLSRAGVEVLDLLPVFLAVPNKRNQEPLTIPSDPHWSPRAEVITADALAPRLHRYAFVQADLADAPRYYTVSVPLDVPGGYTGAFWPFLTPEERRQVAPGLRLQLQQVLDRQTRKAVGPTDAAPVLVMGDSFTSNTASTMLDGAGIVAQIARTINGPVSQLALSGGRTEPLKELARNPDLLAKTKVVVWIINFASFAVPWDPIALPAR